MCVIVFGCVWFCLVGLGNVHESDSLLLFGKYPLGKLSIRPIVSPTKCPIVFRPNIRSANCQSVKCPSAHCLSAKCLFGKLSADQMTVRQLSFGQMSVCPIMIVFPRTLAHENTRMEKDNETDEEVKY